MDISELTKDVESLSCFDNYVLEYFIDNCFVHVENTRPITINVKYLTLDNEKQIQEWYQKHIYDLPIYQYFIKQGRRWEDA